MVHTRILTTAQAFLGTGVVGVLIMIFVGNAWGGGLGVYEMGTPDTGTAIAARAALGEHASTAMLNPAAMTRLEGSQLLLGLQPMIGGPQMSW